MDIRRLYLIVVFVYVFVCYAKSRDCKPLKPQPSANYRCVISHDPDPVYDPLPFDFAIMFDGSENMEEDRLESSRGFRGVQNWLHRFVHFSQDIKESAIAIVRCKENSFRFNDLNTDSDANEVAAEVDVREDKPGTVLSFVECFKVAQENVFVPPYDRTFPEVYGFNKDRNVIVYITACQEPMTETDIKKFYFLIICLPGKDGHGTSKPGWQIEKHETAQYIVYSNYSQLRAALDELIGIPTWIEDCRCGRDEFKCMKLLSDDCHVVYRCAEILTDETYRHRLANPCVELFDVPPSTVKPPITCSSGKDCKIVATYPQEGDTETTSAAESVTSVTSVTTSGSSKGLWFEKRFVVDVASFLCFVFR